jgi:hypothetical protein
MTLSAPSKVLLSAAQNPVKSITPGYRETDLDLLSLEASRPIVLSIPSSPTSDDEPPSPSSPKQRRQLFCQIAVSYAALTLYIPPLPPPSLHL